MLYCIAVEALALDIKKNKKIDGKPLPGTKTSLKILQYADDTTVAARNISLIEEIFKTLKKFERATGSNINRAKTKGLALGGFEPTAQDNILGQRSQNIRNINWTNESGLKILGINFFTDLKHTSEVNWQKAFKNFQQKLKN